MKTVHSCKAKLWLVFAVIAACALCIVVLCACKDKNHTNENLEEIAALEQKIAGRDYVGIKMTASVTIDQDERHDSESDTYAICWFKTEYAEPCLVLTRFGWGDERQDVYYLDNRIFSVTESKYGREFGYKGEINASLNQKFGEEAFLLDKIDGMDQLNLTADKKADGDKVTYTIKFHGYKEVIDTLTDSAFQELLEAADIEFPEAIALTIVAKDGLIAQESMEFGFKVRDTSVTMSIDMVFSYDGNGALPDDVKDYYELYSLRGDVVKAIIPAEDGEGATLMEDYPLVQSGQVDCYMLDACGFMFYDGDGRIVVSCGGYEISVYNAYTLEKLYTMQFLSNIFLKFCEDGKLCICYALNGRAMTGIYSLQDGSLVARLEDTEPRAMIGNKVYVIEETAEAYVAEVIDVTATKELALQYFYKSDIPADYFGVDLELHVDRQDNLFFLCYRLDEMAKYWAYEVDTDRLLYAKQSNELQAYASQRYWMDAVYKVRDKMVIVRTGEVADYVPPAGAYGRITPEYVQDTYDYVFPNGYENYIVWAVHGRFGRYDAIDIVDFNQWGSESNHEYWIYDKQADKLAVRTDGYCGKYIMLEDDLFLKLDPDGQERFVLKISLGDYLAGLVD